MNPFEEFLRRLFGGGPPPTAIEEERQAAGMGRAAQTMTDVSRSLGKSFAEAYAQRTRDLQDLAMQQVRGANAPLSDMTAPSSQAQRDLALDVLGAGAGAGMRVGTELLSSVPGVGQSTLRNAALDRLARSRIFQVSPDSKFADESWRQYGNTLEEARANLSAALARRQLNPEIAAVQQIPVGHSSPFFYEVPEITRRTMETGEGASLKGPGLYVADSPDVYEGHYRKTLARPTGPATVLGGLPLDYRNIKNLSRKLLEASVGSGAGYGGLPEEDWRKAAMLNNLTDKMEADFVRSVKFPKNPNEVLAERESNRRYIASLLKQKQNLENQLNIISTAKKNPRQAFQLWYDTIADDLDKRNLFTERYYSSDPQRVQEENMKYAQQAFERFVDRSKTNETFLKRDLTRVTKRYRGQVEGFVGNLGRRLNISYPERIVATYEGVLGANPNELLHLDRPFFGLEGADLQRVMDAFKNFGTPSGSRGNLADAYLASMEETMRGVPQMSPMTLAEWQAPGNRAMRDLFRDASRNISNVNVNALKGYGPYTEYSSLANEPFDILDALRDQGMVGTKYADAGSRRNFLAPVIDPEEATFNYTVYDPRRIQFTQAYAAANPFAPLSTTMQALRNEKEKKKK